MTFACRSSRTNKKNANETRPTRATNNDDGAANTLQFTMANVTDPLALVRGNDPQNLMEYITRQKIYDSRFWKEECFGLTTVDVLEKSAKTLSAVGGTFGGNRRPTKFLCLTLKLLQLQPDLELIQEFLQQDHFKYARALGAFYLRLTGRPHDVYVLLEPLYADYSKLKYRDVTEWKLLYMDEFVDQLLTQSFACGIALPRLPARETLQEAGYLLDDDNVHDGDGGDVEELSRPTALRDAIQVAGGIKEYLWYKAQEEKSPVGLALWEKRYGPISSTSGEDNLETSSQSDDKKFQMKDGDNKAGIDGDNKTGIPKKKERNTKKRKYGTLFKQGVETVSVVQKSEEEQPSQSANDEEGSEEYWNNERKRLGLKPLRK